MNITGGGAYLNGSGDTVLVNLNNSGANPRFKLTCAGTTSFTEPPGVFVTPTYSFAFSMQDSIVMHSQPVGIGGISGDFFYRVTKVSR